MFNISDLLKAEELIFTFKCPLADGSEEQLTIKFPDNVGELFFIRYQQAVAEMMATSRLKPLLKKKSSQTDEQYESALLKAYEKLSEEEKTARNIAALKYQTDNIAPLRKVIESLCELEDGALTHIPPAMLQQLANEADIFNKINGGTKEMGDEDPDPNENTEESMATSDE